MRTLIVFVLSCASVFGADRSIQVFTTAKTNAETGSITSKEFYTRDGQTNLVRHTKTKAGVIQIRLHRFYQGGSLVGDFLVMPDSTGFTTESGTPYSVSLECDASRNPKSVVIGAKDGVILDAFSYTNGLFTPVERGLLVKANAAGSKTRDLIEDLSARSKKE